MSQWLRFVYTIGHLGINVFLSESLPIAITSFGIYMATLNELPAQYVIGIKPVDGSNINIGFAYINNYHEYKCSYSALILGL